MDINKEISDIMDNLEDVVPSINHGPSTTEEDIISSIREAIDNSNLVIVLGAGVSVDYGIPSWYNLLQGLIIKSIAPQEGRKLLLNVLLNKTLCEALNINPLILGRYARNKYKDDTDFNKAIHELLYKSIEDTPKENTILYKVAQIAKQDKLDSIITYNYDDMLEQIMDNIGIETESLHFEAQVKEGIGFPIYHVHGYIPQDEDKIGSNNIILDESSYHYEYSDKDSWNNKVQLELFKEKTCLFLGVSLTDPNMRRILDTFDSTNVKHYIMRKKSKLPDNAIDVLLEFSAANLKQIRRELEGGAYSALKLAGPLYDRFYEVDDLSLGVGTLWVDDYGQIPSKLDDIFKLK